MLYSKKNSFAFCITCKTRNSATAEGPRVSKFVLYFTGWELEMFHTAKVTFKFQRGHWQWCHSTGHIRFPIRLPLRPCLYVAQFSRYYHLFHKNLKRSRDPQHIPFGGNLSFLYQYTSVSISTRHLKCLVLPTPKT